MDDVRLFVAIPAPPEIRHVLLSAGLSLKKRLGEEHFHGKLRLVPPENIHLTLFFLGDLPATEVQVIKQQLAGVSVALPQPRFRISGGGVFPARGNPRVAWCGVDDLDRSLEGAAKAVAQAVGRTLDRFRPHFTLGYLKGQDPHGVVRSAVSAACPQAREPASHAVPEMVLFESRLHPSGAQHIALERYSFGGGS